MQLTEPDAALLHQIADLPQWHAIARLGVAVSGGSDSMSLLHLLAHAASARGVGLEVATVDHGLRPEATEEARLVAEACAALGLRHDTLSWTGWTGTGNLQAEARAARYRLLADWARARGLDAVALAHTRDDQAETFLLRLARQAGVDGLAAMAGEIKRGGMRFWRPVLGCTRAELRAFLERRGVTWSDDPSNEDPAYDRVRVRAALDTLAGLGIDRATLAGVAAILGDASRALKRTTHDLAAGIARVEAGDVVIDRAALASADPEIARRLLVAALVWVAVSEYPPRRAAVAELISAIAEDRGHTLHGCRVTSDQDFVRISRELAAVQGLETPFGAEWDGRWRLAGPGTGGVVRALGEAVTDCPDWRETGLPRATLMVSPALWRGETLVAAPLAGFGAGYSATIDHPAGDFAGSVLSH